MGRPFARRLAAAALLGLFAVDAHAQYFGRNKVRYDQDAVRVLATVHFDIYYPQSDAETAIIAGRLAERWYTRLSKALDHSLSGRQPIILYGSHRTFEQTNVLSSLIGENTGGFTEARKRRIVVPFASSLKETDHVLGHEIVHAFQYDIAARSRTTINTQLWFVEGMAEYLTLGPDDPLTAMWMRDAVKAGKLPTIRELASPRLFPYRWGAALWAYLAGRFGADLPSRALRTRRDVLKRLQELTGETADALTAGWHASLREKYGSVERGGTSSAEAIISSRKDGGRMNLAASISPDGRRLVFLSERDQFSIDLFLADATTGAVTRKLITTAGDAKFESLQYLNSAGAWDPEGRQFALATVRSGRPALTIIDIDGRSPPRELMLDGLDEIYSPTWSPNGHVIAFSGMGGGVTDLFTLDLVSGERRRLTNDAFADLQPAWSPDGRTIAFTTDRFTTDLTLLRFGPYRIGLLDVDSGLIKPVSELSGATLVNPAWAARESGLFVLSDAAGAMNVFRIVPGGGAFQVTWVDTGVSGVTRLSPALSTASVTGALTYSVFHDGGYEIHTIPALPGGRLAGIPVARSFASGPAADTPADTVNEPIDPVPPLPDVEQGTEGVGRSYRPKLALEAIGSPYFSAGGGSLGGSVQGGASLLFGDLLGDRQMMAAVHLSSRLDESAVGVAYLDRAARWSWGFTLEQAPEIRFRSSSFRFDPATPDTVARDRERQVWTYRSGTGFVAYPFSRTQRVEVSGGFHHISFEQQIQTQVFSSHTGRILESGEQRARIAPAVSIVEAGIALVGDTTTFGATGPLVGTRYRIQVTPAAGGLSYTRLLADYRRYFMPVRPYTLAIRLVHAGRVGRDADDVRLRETYVGSSSLVRGYGAGTVARSECRGDTSNCPALNTLLGASLLVAKLELRVPVFGALSSRVRYDPVPIDAFAFADAGTSWGGHQQLFGPGRDPARVIRSVGAGVRVNAMGLLLEFSTVRPLDLKDKGWSFGLMMRPGF